MRRMLFVAVSCIILTASANATEHLVTQQGKAFSAKTLTAHVGDTLNFRNEDPFVHNIFSLSDVLSFDLGTFAKGEARQVKLSKPGVVEIECAVHPEMKLVVEVK